ncbi:MAG TPA: hypothetical protein ENH91_12710 [Leeuwenhoekiella sp.]|nr:hypothetical protein [Leeuwenhoekiella sp.]
MIYRFRVILDAKEDVFRDIEVQQDATLEDFHNCITQSFGFDGMEVASFFTSDDEWHQHEEIPLFDMEDTEDPVRTMQATLVEDVVSKDETRLIYVYDFLNLWTFFVELADIAEAEDGIRYPNLLFTHGQIPAEAPPADFSGDEEPEEDGDAMDFEDDYDIDDLENLGFDENWN